MEEDECKTEFRFLKIDIYDLAAILQIPGEIVCYNKVTFDAVEGLCTLLKRFYYPCRYTDMIHIFDRPVPQLSILTNNVTDYFYDR